MVIELHDDHRFVMFRVDPKSQFRTETLLDVPTSHLGASGNQSFLVLRSGIVKRRIDFPNPNQLSGFLAGGVIGAAVADAYANPSGIRTWVEALRAHGAQVRYSGMSTSMKVVFIAFGVVFGSVLLLGFAASLLNN